MGKKHASQYANFGSLQSSLLNICYVTTTFNEVAIKVFLCFMLLCSIIYVFLHIQNISLMEKTVIYSIFFKQEFCTFTGLFPF